MEQYCLKALPPRLIAKKGPVYLGHGECGLHGISPCAGMQRWFLDTVHHAINATRIKSKSFKSITQIKKNRKSK